MLDDRPQGSSGWRIAVDEVFQHGEVIQTGEDLAKGGISIAPGTAGFLSLRLGSGARYSAMGDVGVSLARDATAAYWNPASLTAVETTSLALQHSEWISSVRVESFYDAVEYWYRLMREL